MFGAPLGGGADDGGPPEGGAGDGLLSSIAVSEAPGWPAGPGPAITGEQGTTGTVSSEPEICSGPDCTQASVRSGRG